MSSEIDVANLVVRLRAVHTYEESTVHIVNYGGILIIKHCSPGLTNRVMLGWHKYFGKT